MKTWVSLVSAMLLLITGLVAAAPAEVVGRITQVEGRVDLLKGGQLPATPVKLEDPVDLGDVLRTKSLSKANITFVDNTVITISPESRIAIEEYMFDPANGKRNAVLQLFHGMALAVVSKIFKAEQPDFVIKTHTAIMGVRGTEVGVRLSANDSTFLNFQGLTRVASIFPEISGDLFRKAAKVALSFGKGYVDLGNMQATTVTRGMTPTLPYGISNEDRQMFMRQMVVSTLGPQGGGKTSPAVCSPTASTCTTNSVASSSSSETASNAALGSGTGTGGLNSGVQVIQLLPPPTQVSTVATIVNLAFSPSFSYSFPTGSIIINNPNSNIVGPQPPPTISFGITGPVPSNSFSLISLPTSSFTLQSLSFTASLPTSPAGSPSLIWFSPGNNPQGTFNGTSSGLSGSVGGNLSGTMTMTLNISNYPTFTLQGPVTYSNGIITFNSTSGTFTTVAGSTGTVSSSLWTWITATTPIAPAITTAAAAAATQVRNVQLAGTRTGGGLHLRR